MSNFEADGEKRFNLQAGGEMRCAVLWDMDGTLIDSTEYHWIAWRDLMRSEGRAITYEEFLAGFGKRNEAILRDLFGEDLPPAELNRLADAKERHYRELVRARGIALLPGAREWLEKLKDAGWRQALATSAPRLNAEVVLKATNIERVFDAVISAEDVERGKPDPQVFLRAAAKLEIEPWRCLVVEDAPAGIEAGRQAGMRTIGVLTSHESLDADLVVRRLDELPTNAFANLLSV